MDKFKLDSFNHSEPVVNAAWLRDELAKLRPEGLSVQGFSKLRRDAHIMVRGKDGNLKPQAGRTLTQQQAARLVFAGLYKPNGIPLIKKAIDGPNLNDIQPLEFRQLFDTWASIGAPYGKSLLEEILKIPTKMTVGEFLSSAEKVTGGMSLSLSAIRRALKCPRRKILKSTQLEASERATLMIWLADIVSESNPC